MSNEVRNSLTAAEILYGVRTRAHAIEQLPEIQRPQNIVQSYQLQDELNKKLSGELGLPMGYKIGCTTEVMQSYLNIPHPCAGRIFQSTAQFAAQFAAQLAAQLGQAQYRLAELCRPGVECEIAVLIGKDMPAGNSYTAQQSYTSIDAVMASIELVDDRWIDYQSVDVYSLIAENFFGAGCVFGEPVSLSFDELASVTGELRVNGSLIGTGCGADILGHPCEALAWLANHQVERGSPLRAGDYVSLGSVVKTQWLDVGDTVDINFAGLGACSLTLIA